MKNLLIAQSGGPTAAINATLAGIIAQALLQDEIDHIYGGQHGIKGILEEQFIDLRKVIANTSDLERLTHTPASALGSCRFKLLDPDIDDSQFKQLINIFRKYQIAYFIYIGGNDSMDTVAKLARYCRKLGIHDLKIIGAPKTIDNDLTEIDHCPGFGSAAKYIATTFAELWRDISVYDTFGVTIVEVMGRNAGWLTAASALARQAGHHGPDLIYLCERPFSTTQFLHTLRTHQGAGRNLLVAVSEGLKDEHGHYLSEQTTKNATDVFGHQNLAGTGKILEQLVREEIGCKVRSIELNLMQRCAGHLTSQTDLDEAKLLGAKALQCALAGQSGVMATLRRRSNTPYQIQLASVSVDLVANQEKTVPLSWISEDGTDITDEMMDYLSPLANIQPFNHLIL